MSKTHPPKSKAAKKKAPASAKSGPATKKTASKTVAKKITAKSPAKKTPAAKAKPKSAAPPPTKKAALVRKKAPLAKKAFPAKKTVVKKAPIKKAPAANKKVAPAKKALPTAKQAVIEKKATPVKKATAPVAKTPAKKTATPTPTKAPAKAKTPAPAPGPVAKKVVAKEKVSPPAIALTPVPAPQAEPVAKKKAAVAKASAAPASAAPIAPPEPPKAPVLSLEKPEATKTGALFYDSHMHTPLCKHAWGEPEEYAAQALKAGLKGIIFTCHCPMPDGFWPSVRMSNSEFDTYVEIVQRAAAAYAGRLDVCLGLESEFFPGHEKWIADLHKRADFDYILGAVHWQSKDYLTKFESGTIENFRRIYFEHLAQSAETGLYDCLAHPDLVKNYHPDSWCFAIIKDTVAKVLDRIAKTGVAMELNTSGLNKSYAEMNPGNEMLRMMAERGIPVVIGSDSHKSIRVGEHFITALNHLAEAGYEEVNYFKKRQRIPLKISDVLASIRKAIDANS